MKTQLLQVLSGAQTVVTIHLKREIEPLLVLILLELRDPW